MKLKKKTLLVFLTLILGVAAFIYGVFIEPDRLIVLDYPVRLQKWPAQLNGFKIVVLSDLHVGSLHIDARKLQLIVDESNKQNADLILLLGDYVASGKRSCLVKPAAFTGELSRLKARLGVYAVLGNHDWWYDGVDVRNCLQAANITVLEDASVSIDSNGTTFYLTGLSDMWTRSTNIEKALSPVPENATVIVMSHNPDVFPSMPPRVALTLAGHTHGGQVSLPLVGAIITPSDYGSRYARGLIVENGKTMFVSSGIGTSIFPIRINVPPEISVLQLHSSP